MNPHLYTDKPLPQRLFEEFLNEMKDQIKDLKEFKICIGKITISNALGRNSRRSGVTSMKITLISFSQPFGR
jgi:hypothetical protein